MDRELARKRPAIVLNVQTERVPDLKTLPRRDYLEGTFHEKRALMVKVHKMARAGEIGTTYRVRETERGWRVEVIRLREHGRNWRKVGLITAVSLAMAGGVVWLVALALQALAVALAAVLPILLGVAGVVGLLALLALLASLGGGTTINQTVNMK
jgi:hypothetical protein